MCNDGEYYVDSYHYRAKPGGALYCSEWYQDEWDNWYYYCADAKPAIGYNYVNGTPYFFFYGGRMVYDQTVNDDEGYWYRVSENGIAHWLPNATWTLVDGEWYYVWDNQICMDDLYWIDGAYYYFDWIGAMYHDTDFYYDDYSFRAKEDGKLCCNEWYQDEWGNWYYYGADCKAVSGYQVINGVPYLFTDYGRMYTNTTIRDDGYWYMITEDGYAHWLPNGAWTLVEGEYYYVMNDRICSDGVFQIDGAYYGFNDNGAMYADTTFYSYGSWYCAKANGMLYRNEWYQDKWDNLWYYYCADCTAAYGLTNIAGVEYYFNFEGNMATSTIIDNYFIDENGIVVRAQGWRTFEGDYYYINQYGLLHEGWLLDGGRYYYMKPAMSYGEFCIIDNVLYLLDVNGNYTALTADGMYDILGSLCYVEGGKVISNQWKYIDGYYYYFNYDCVAIRNRSREIGEKTYYFDDDCKMQTGWISYYESYMYADESGALVTGLNNIGGVNYYFSNGYLATEGFYMINGISSYVNKEGIYITPATVGWNQFDGKWYYIDEDGMAICYTTRDINGLLYGFNYDGEMVTNNFFHGKYFNADGIGITQVGWHFVDGSWIYVMDEWGDLANYLTMIDGISYYFDDYKLVTNSTFIYGDELFTSDANGVITRTSLPLGWFYNNGTYYYFDGNDTDYTGWIGDYFINNGYMSYNEIIYDNGKYYYIQPNGLCYYNGWKLIEDRYDDEDNYYICAKPDGSLYFNEWMFSNGNWYYFSRTRMAENGNYYIDGKYHRFGEDGIYLGEVSNNTANGWVYENDNWYFYNAGERHSGWLYDNAWYYFDFDTGMCKDVFCGDYYLKEDGTIYTTPGWSLINGEWVYFYNGGKVASGWFSDGTNTYFAYYTYDSVVLAKGYRSVNNNLYSFAEDGRYIGQITADGWYTYDGDWYYIKDGKAANGKITIDGANYFFYSGMMATDEVVWFYDEDKYEHHIIYVNANGYIVTTEGWYNTEYGWIYIGADGELYVEGIYFINGVQYAFDTDGYLL